MDEELLHGGIANMNAVKREGRHVTRPSNPYSRQIHRFLTAINKAGFDGASVPVGIDPSGRERLHFVKGDVPIPPYPVWAQSERALASMVELIKRLHIVSAAFDPVGSEWSAELEGVEVRGGRRRAPNVV